MHPTAERIQQLLHSLAIDTTVVEFSTSTRTSAEAAAAIGTTVAQICKSIVFAAPNRAIIVMASGSNRIDTAKVSAHLGQPITKANAAFVRQHTGFVIGGVPPIGHPEPLTILVDRDLLQFPLVYAAAGTPNSIFPISPANLVHITQAQLIDCRLDEPNPA